MVMGAASVLLMMMVSLEALLLLVAVAGTSAAAVSGTGSTIRLPSDGRAPAGVAAALVRAMARAKLGDDEKRPWECCDFAICTLSIPPICRCVDQVDRCSDACKDCEETEDNRHVCFDTYQGDPGPRCHEYGNNNGRQGPLHVRTSSLGQAAALPAAVMADDRKNAGGHDDDDDDDDEKRPWKCCDVPICTRSWPPICRCADTVERCASTCEHCEQVEEGTGGGPRYLCLDTHRGDPGPSCGEQQDGGGDHRWARRLAGDHRF